MKIVSDDFLAFFSEVGKFISVLVFFAIGVVFFIPTLGWSWKLPSYAYENWIH